ncbi:putative lipoprotein NlpE involved in copper resistance [Belliella baltica DSM 15883]|uniref:Putative lipoprotein NlpE involved in copper resistance n=1 Tax=Belliella baltica (strain DSM 15883 / CIP 108006 / LMG 21964 / BA134) TaxID=866536 RepID=I3Z8X6_BELBD|nr:copper resistance protein NlpE [Belliella baltica]AFL85694.1 putative lipoprotein NlpE involved in copper resistance [Belliella baltica DSM 15883]
MKNTLKLYLAISCFILLISCQKSSPTEEIIVDDALFETEEFSEEFKEEHNALNSLDYMGVYSGVLPCADCEGIETTIELGSGNSYVKKVIYLGKDNQQIVETGGTFTWNEAGNTITLNEEDMPNQYFVGENILFHLDMEGNRITGELAEKYELRKE